MSSCPLLVWALAGSARAGLSVDPSDPPVVEAMYPDGGVRVRFPGVPVSLDSLGAAVVTVRRGAEPPAELLEAGRRIGARNVVVPVRPGEDALQVALRWAAHPEVLAAVPDLVIPRERRGSFDDPERPGQWYLDELGMEALYDRSLGDPAVKLAVVDGPIDIHHPDLAAGVIEPYDAIEDDLDPSPSTDCPDPPDCIDGHGTATAGIAAARADNGVGLVGLCPGCSLVPVGLIGGSTSLSQDLAAFQHLRDVDAWVVNNSWGYTVPIQPPTALEELIVEVATLNRGGLGAVVVFAAGNDDRRIEGFELESNPEFLCVSATDRYGLPTNYTNSGRPVDLAAPSATVSLAPGGGITTTFGGTSAAAPVVAGLSGWLLSVEPGLSAAEVRALLVETAHKTSQVTFDEDGHHPIYGYGEVDPPALLARLYGTGGTGDTGASEEPRGCGCGSAPGTLPGGGLLGALGLAAGWRARRRR